MSRRRELIHQQQKLGEAREIVSSMKSLAFMESRRLGQSLDVQRQIVRTMERAAADFLRFHPDLLPETDAKGPSASPRHIFLLLGSERGFCGNFNESLLASLDTYEKGASVEKTGVIAFGQKLCNRLEGDPRLITGLDGAAVLDEVPGALNRLVDTLTELQAGEDTLRLTTLFHDPEQEAIVSCELLPPFQHLSPPEASLAGPPQLNLDPARFLLELVDQYLFATLHEMLFVSMMAENLQRMQHLEGAVRYLDQNLDSLQRRSNQLRQEEITEEIEVILLSSVSVAPPTVD
ncbi:F0F1 ATP synthase subunit gamma [Microbulbifer hydrolyticus]|uniref:F-type H+-transporting ATPase subunit gamma n=1 Tax=Microbulbifer hydrolyticus TaxID=48074 RepID=A0A6P1T8J3_9GAMM|nr:FoF1 ATP synthase subunit gamma [Microbulbifer hydrolyticus]MBB5210407.1 F-type H+-transporting ATPase subunit gamma [Microbulbifer hydrolyticus]QHQ39108.1 F0F1 ATP synthase subunit gamma [Microbulbifer hydrolyticus]